MRNRIITSTCLVFFLWVVLFASVNSVEVNLVFENGSVATLYYDRYNSTLGSFSYKDNSIRNPNVLVNVCEIPESFVGKFIDLMYSTESGNLTQSVLTLKPMITNVSSNCSLVDVDISAFEALFPAVPFARIYAINGSNITTLWFGKLNQTFNGSYLLGVSIDDVDKKTMLVVRKIFDENGTEENQTERVNKENLFITIALDGHYVAEGRTAPNKVIAFDYMFTSNETVYVNGIPSLRVKAFDPCGVINETGYYYVLNRSAWNVNDTCVVVENTDNIVLDFANRTVDGDANTTVNQTKCGIIIRNSYNITLKDVRVQEFYRGVCIVNSSGIQIIGKSDQYNLQGIYVYNSTARVSGIKLYNNESEILAKSKGYVNLYKTAFQTANVSGHFFDVVMRNVFNPPPDPEGLKNIGQWVSINKTEEDAWIYRIGFNFVLPKPTKAIPKTIYKIDGELVNGTWKNLNWTQLNPTYVDVANREIFALLNVSDFSIFAPYAEKIEPEQVPTPQPQPVPTPSAQIVGTQEQVVPPKLNLTLETYEVVVQQGETVGVKFNLTNEGDIAVAGPFVTADVRKGWKVGEAYFTAISPGETKNGTVYLTVYENEIPGTYFVPVKAVLSENNVTVDVEILKVIVIPRRRVAKIDVLEVPPFLSLPELTSFDVAVLVKNSGDFDLHNLKIIAQYADDCIERIEGSYSLKVGEEKSLVYTFHTKKAPSRCKAILVFKSDEGLVGFAPVIIQIVPQRFLGLIEFKWLYVILIIWSIATAYRVWKVRREEE